METIKVADKVGLSGSFVIRTHKPGDIAWFRDEDGQVQVDLASLKSAMQKPLSEHSRVHNRIVSADGYGRNLLLRQMSGDTTYPILIDSGAIGTGTATPADGDTALATPILTGISARLHELTNDVMVVSFFIPDGDLADDTYKEFALYMGTQLFAHALITPTYAKAGVDTTIEYTITFSS